MTPDELRAGPVAEAIRRHRLIVVLRRIEPRGALIDLVDELADAGARIFEVTMDAPSAAGDIEALRAHVPDGVLVGAGTVLDTAQLESARSAGADFAVAPLLDASLVRESIASSLPFVAGALTPTEISAAWDAGATFVKLFPASAVGPGAVRELRGPLPHAELIPTGGIDAGNARAFLDAGAAAVGIGGALVRADPAARHALVASLVGGGDDA